MATVRLSKTIRDEIRTKLAALRTRSLDAVAALEQVTASNQAVEEIEALVWGKHHHLKSQMPDAWCNTLPAMNGVTLRGDVRCGDSGTPCQYTMQLAVARDVLLPPNTNRWGLNIKRASVTPELPVLNKLVHEFEAKVVARSEEAARWAPVEKAVVAALESSGTLKQACDKLPALVHYVPDEYKRRMEEKVVRSSKGDVEEEESFVVPEGVEDLMRVAAVSARLGAL